ncbi:MAG TPA: YceI family protein [Pirellulaceae bacterium]|nr:YceI family protein [Pirellulaceae bacterium]
MSRVALGTALMMFVAVGSLQAAEPLKLDTKNSTIEFVGKKSDGEHKGGFKKFEAEATTDAENPTKGTLKIVIDATSLWSDADNLTNHLKNPDFFDVRKHPKITFVATKMAQESETKGSITGDLTMLGKTVTITVPAEAKTTADSTEVTTSFKLDRTKWGMNYGEGKVDKEVDVTAKLVFVR